MARSRGSLDGACFPAPSEQIKGCHIFSIINHL
jgi:hypothetical protein